MTPTGPTPNLPHSKTSTTWLFNAPDSTCKERFKRRSGFSRQIAIEAPSLAVLASLRKEHHSVHGAGHYYFDQPDKLAQGVALAASWLARSGFIDRTWR